jgi:hypothetical protein
MPQTTHLDAWLKEFPRVETEARIRDLEGEITNLRNALSLYDSLVPSNGTQPTGAGTPLDTPPKGRRDAIRRILREGGNQPMSSTEIKDIMRERGWLTPGQENMYYAAVSTMAKKGGHLLRLQDGRYVLPPGKGDNVS